MRRMSSILTTRVFSRQFWHSPLAPVVLGHVTPRRSEPSFAGEANRSINKAKEEINSGCDFGDLDLMES